MMSWLEFRLKGTKRRVNLSRMGNRSRNAGTWESSSKLFHQGIHNRNGAALVLDVGQGHAFGRTPVAVLVKAGEVVADGHGLGGEAVDDFLVADVAGGLGALGAHPALVDLSATFQLGPHEGYEFAGF